MIQTIVVFLLIGLIIAGIIIYPLLINWHRKRLKNRPFPPLWQAITEHNLPIYTCLSSDERRQLHGNIQVFLAEKQFIGCQGLQVTDEMKIILASVAGLLLLNQRGKYFPRLRSILVYPHAYLVDVTKSMGNYVVETKREARLGESWTNDQVILSWEQVKYDINHWRDGHNVILHEFAHQLDQEDGKAEGVPILPDSLDYLIWSQVMTAAELNN